MEEKANETLWILPYDDGKRTGQVSQERGDSLMFKAAQRMIPLTDRGWKALGMVAGIVALTILGVS